MTLRAEAVWPAAGWSAVYGEESVEADDDRYPLVAWAVVGGKVIGLVVDPDDPRSVVSATALDGFVGYFGPA
jgi:hypothetical protein